MYQQHPPRWSPTDQESTAAESLPTMYDLPSESPEDRGSHPQWYKRPDWFLVLGTTVAERVEDLRWSDVTWQEEVNPFLVVELLSPGTEDEDLGQKKGRELGNPPLKWVVYEQILRVPFYQYSGQF